MSKRREDHPGAFFIGIAVARNEQPPLRLSRPSPKPYNRKFAAKRHCWLQQNCGCIPRSGFQASAGWIFPGRRPRDYGSLIYNRRFAAEAPRRLQHICGCIPIPSRFSRSNLRFHGSRGIPRPLIRIQPNICRSAAFAVTANLRLHTRCLEKGKEGAVVTRVAIASLSPDSYTTANMLQNGPADCSKIAVVYPDPALKRVRVGVFPGRRSRAAGSLVYNRRFAAERNGRLQRNCGCIPFAKCFSTIYILSSAKDNRVLEE